MVSKLYSKDYKKNTTTPTKMDFMKKIGKKFKNQASTMRCFANNLKFCSVVEQKNCCKYVMASGYTNVRTKTYKRYDLRKRRYIDQYRFSRVKRSDEVRNALKR